MRKQLILAMAFTAFVILGISSITKTDNKLKFKEIELKSTKTELIQLDLKFDVLNKKLEEEQKSNVHDEKKIQDLETEKVKLQQERDKLQKDLQAKAKAKQDAQQKIAQAASIGSTKAYAASGDCVSEIAKYNWNQSTAIAVARAESGLRPDAHNLNHATKDNSWGCFQINIYGANANSRPPSSELVKASVNVAYAYKLYVGSGNSFKSQWGVCRKIACY